MVLASRATTADFITKSEPFSVAACGTIPYSHWKSLNQALPCGNTPAQSRNDNPLPLQENTDHAMVPTTQKRITYTPRPSPAAAVSLRLVRAVVIVSRSF